MILLTGGSGFIGSNLLAKLNKIGRTDVIVVDNINSNEKFNNLSGLNYLYNINKNYLWKWIQDNQPELSLIIHLGACTDTTQLDKKYLKNNNVDYSKRLFEIAVKSRDTRRRDGFPISTISVLIARRSGPAFRAAPGGTFGTPSS